MEMKYSRTSLLAVFISPELPGQAEDRQLTRRRLSHVVGFLYTDEHDLE
jgi:hypothetical protein